MLFLNSSAFVRVHLPDRDRGCLAQKATRAIRVPVAARDLVTLAHQEPREQRAGGAGPEDEDSHLIKGAHTISI